MSAGHRSKLIALLPVFVCLFGVYRPTREFLLIWRRHHYRCRSANFDLCLALMAIEPREFFSVPRLLWHGASVYNGHLRGLVTLTLIAELLAVELSLPVFMTSVCGGWDSNTQPSACGANAQTHCTTAAVPFCRQCWRLESENSREGRKTLTKKN